MLTKLLTNNAQVRELVWSSDNARVFGLSERDEFVVAQTTNMIPPFSVYPPEFNWQLSVVDLDTTGHADHVTVRARARRLCLFSLFFQKRGIAVSSKGVVAIGGDGIVSLVAAPAASLDYTVVHQISDLPAHVSSVAFSSDDRMLAVGCADGSVHLYGTGAGGRPALRARSAHLSAPVRPAHPLMTIKSIAHDHQQVSRVSFGGNAAAPLLLAASGASACVWEAAKLSAAPRVALAGKGADHVVGAAFTRCNKYVVAAMSDGSLGVWCTRDAASVFTARASRPATAFSLDTDKGILVVGLENGVVEQYQAGILPWYSKGVKAIIGETVAAVGDYMADPTAAKRRRISLGA